MKQFKNKFSVKRSLIVTTCCCLFVLVSCKKYLDEKPDQQLAIPETLEDAQALLDYYSILNANYPNIGDQSDDNIYLNDARLNALPLVSRNYYTWAENITNDAPYSVLYRIILNATVAEELTNSIPKTSANQAQWNTVKGTASFYKAFALYFAAQYYAVPYDSAVATRTPGVPLRPTSDATLITTRATMAETWNYIASRFEEAAGLLPETSLVRSRPTKQAAYAALARIRLAMGRYNDAAAAARSALDIYDDLIDFNTLNPNATNPFTLFNKEVIFPASASAVSHLAPAIYSLDTLLYNSYESNDLRKTMYFRLNSIGKYGFKANLSGNANAGPFVGMAVDEVFLIYAESLARTGRTTEAMNALNDLLRTRWRTGTFNPFTAAGPDEALTVILQERRKELVLRGTRWTDLRRLNKNSVTQTTPVRIINNVPLQLAPGSNRYTFYYPLKVIELSGIPQNIR